MNTGRKPLFEFVLDALLRLKFATEVALPRLTRLEDIVLISCKTFYLLKRLLIQPLNILSTSVRSSSTSSKNPLPMNLLFLQNLQLKIMWCNFPCEYSSNSPRFFLLLELRLLATDMYERHSRKDFVKSSPIVLCACFGKFGILG